MFFGEWFDILLYKKKPEQLVADKPGLGKAFGSYIVAILISMILSAIAGFLTVSKTASALGITGQSVFTGIYLVALVVGFMIALVIVFIGNALIFLFAKLVGGKGDFSSTLAVLFSVEAAFAGTIGIFGAIISLLVALVPSLSVVSLAWSAVSLAAGLYALIWYVLVVKHVQSLSTGMAVVAVIVIPLILFVILAIIIGALIWSWIMSLQSNMMSTSGMFSLLQ